MNGPPTPLRPSRSVGACLHQAGHGRGYPVGDVDKDKTGVYRNVPDLR